MRILSCHLNQELSVVWSGAGSAAQEDPGQLPAPAVPDGCHEAAQHRGAHGPGGQEPVWG